MNGQVYFSKGTFSKDFADSVKLDCSLGSLPCFAEAQFDQLDELTDVLSSRGILSICPCSHALIGYQAFRHLRSLWIKTIGEVFNFIKLVLELRAHKLLLLSEVLDSLIKVVYQVQVIFAGAQVLAGISIALNIRFAILILAIPHLV